MKFGDGKRGAGRGKRQAEQLRVAERLREVDTFVEEDVAAVEASGHSIED
jgi:hypothetical protein